MHELADASTSAFVRFAIMQMAGGECRGDAPRDAWFAAGIAGALVEDCGPCVQIASDMAVEAGMPGEIIAHYWQEPRPIATPSSALTMAVRCSMPAKTSMPLRDAIQNEVGREEH